ncbi:hypothetical protein STENM327S_06917 [Streptomyces tendae]
MKAYGSGETRVVALDHVDVDIARGQFTAIMGPGVRQVHADALPGRPGHRHRRSIYLDETEITGLKDKKLTQLRRDRIGFIFQAFVVIGPLLAGFVVRVISAVLLRAFGPVGRLAERNALRNPRRTGATGAALMIGLALVACLSVVGSSMVASATSELDRRSARTSSSRATSGSCRRPRRP